MTKCGGRLEGVAAGRGMRRLGFYPSAALISRLLWTVNDPRPGFPGLWRKDELRPIFPKLKTFVSIAELTLCVRYLPTALPTVYALILMANPQKDTVATLQVEKKNECA